MIDETKLPDEKIVELICSKDKKLYSEIIKRYQDKLMRYTLYLIRDNDKAKDIVQETFIKAYINLNSFNTKKKFSNWIYRIAHNETINFLKKYKKEISLNDNLKFENDNIIEDNFLKTELKDLIWKCIDKIPTSLKEPLILYYFEEKSYEEISDVLRIPIGTVGTKINRAKILLKKICQEMKK